MTLTTTIVTVFLGIFVVVLVTIFVMNLVTDKPLRTALTSFLALLTTLIGAMVAPSISGNADVDLRFGPFGSIRGEVLRVDPPTPQAVWYVAFVTLSILTLYALHQVAQERRSTAGGSNK